MMIRMITYKCGDSDMFWTYVVYVNSELMPSPPLIYRLYKKESTAIHNGMKRMTKLYPKIKSKGALN
jgi:hypothetical protein